MQYTLPKVEYATP